MMKTPNVSLGSSYGGHGGRYKQGRRSASLTLAVRHTVRNDSVLDLLATGLQSTVAQTEAEVGVVAEAGGVRLAVDSGAAQLLLLAEHVLDAGSLYDVFSKRRMANIQDKGGKTYATLGNGVDVLGVNGAEEGTGEDDDRLHLDCWFWCWAVGLIVAAR